MPGRKKAGTAASAAMAYGKESLGPTKRMTGSKGPPKVGTGQASKPAFLRGNAAEEQGEPKMSKVAERREEKAEKMGKGQAKPPMKGY